MFSLFIILLMSTIWFKIAVFPCCQYGYFVYNSGFSYFYLSCSKSRIRYLQISVSHKLIASSIMEFFCSTELASNFRHLAIYLSNSRLPIHPLTQLNVKEMFNRLSIHSIPRSANIFVLFND